MSTQRIQGVIFDLDGTLYQMNFMKLKMTLQLPGSIGYLKKLFRARSAVRRHRYENRQKLLDAFYLEMATLTGKSNAQVQDWFERRFYQAFIRILAKHGTPREGVVSLLSRLRECGVKTAVVSDFGRVRSRLEALHIDPDLLDVIKCSEECGVLKPDPEPFASVARLWNLAPENVLVVGDRDDMDGEGARRAGMKFLGITEKRKTQADFYCWNDALMKIETITNCGVSV